MRKIEEQMVEAIDCGKDWHKDNTAVKIERIASSQRIICVYLHGNRIAQINKERREVVISDCGWQTNTTKSRLNAILNHYGLIGIHQSKGIWYRGKNEFIGAELIK